MSEVKPVVLESELSKEVFDAWKDHPATIAVFNVLRSTRAEQAELLVSGYTLRDDPGVTAQYTAKLVGIINGMDAILEMQIEDDEEGGEEIEYQHG